MGGLEDYAAAARARSNDAAILQDAGRSLAAVYLLGYSVECGLKALLHQDGRRFATSGRSGHNLQGLWEAAGFKRRDLRGARLRFFDEWSTDLRYRRELPATADPALLLRGGMELVGYVQLRARRRTRRGRRA